MRIVFLVLLVFSTVLSYAQLEAVTKDGREVILHENGNWEFKKELVVEADTKIKLDKALTGQSEMEEMYFAVSKRLERFFSGTKNKIRGKSMCIFENGQAKIAFQWETYLEDGNRYFGYLKEGTKVSLKMKNNENIDLILSQAVGTDIREKYKVTIFTGTALLSPEQLHMLLTYPVETTVVNWKKDAEEYPVNDGDFYRHTFHELMKK
jgi:hypothetical protein